LLEPGAAAKLCKSLEPASVLHLAWIAAAGEYRHSAENLAWVRASLELAASLGTAQRLVVAGSCMDDAGPDRHLTEQWPSLYGVAKSALYRLLCYAGGKANLPHFAWARIFFFYGPEQRGARLVPEVIRCLLADRPAICGPGTPVRDYLHADDVASALVAILDSSLEGTVDVASGRGCSVASLTQNLAAQLGRPHLLRLGERPAAPEPDRIVGDNRRLLHELGWHPQVPLDEGLARTVAWWREQLAAAPGPSA